MLPILFLVQYTVHTKRKFSSINGSSIRKYIQKIKNNPGASGEIIFDKSGALLKAVTLVQVQGKSFKTLGHLTVMTNSLFYYLKGVVMLEFIVP